MALFPPLFGFFSPRTSGYEAQKEPQLAKKLPITNFKSQIQIASKNVAAKLQKNQRLKF